MSRASGVHSLRVSAAGAIGLREPAGAWRHAGTRLSARSATWAVLTLAARPKAVRATRKAERNARRQKTTTIAEPAL